MASGYENMNDHLFIDEKTSYSEPRKRFCFSSAFLQARFRADWNMDKCVEWMNEWNTFVRVSLRPESRTRKSARETESLPRYQVPIGTYCTTNDIKSINKLRKKLFALTTVSRPLPDCDAYNPLCQYIAIYVRLFLSLADWKSLNPLIIPALKVYLLSRRRMTNATSQFFFHLESTSTVMFTRLNYNNDTFCWL